MKKASLIIFVLFLIAAPCAAIFAQNTNPVVVSLNIPGSQPVSAGPCGWISNFYNFALLISGLLAFGAIVYGGVKYSVSAGNPSQQSEGRSWITGALLGLLLLGCAYLILYTINPALVNCSLPTLSTLTNVAPAQTGGTTGGGTTTNGGVLTQSQAQTYLDNAQISVTSSGNCTDQTNPNCTSLVGMQQSTINELVSVKGACGCDVTVTGGTEVGHAAGDLSHANGYKADVAINSQLNNYIQQNFQSIGTRSDGAPQYQDPSTGAIYALETANNHWDITVPGGP